MESIYYVLRWHCHWCCKHCYSSYSNICIGCDSFFRDHLGPVLADLHRQRIKRRVNLIPAHQIS